MGSSPGLISSTAHKKRKPRAPFERRITRFSILLVLPGIVVSGILIWMQPWSLQSKLILLLAELIVCLLIGAALHEHVVRPLQTLAWFMPIRTRVRSIGAFRLFMLPSTERA